MPETQANIPGDIYVRTAAGHIFSIRVPAVANGAPDTTPGVYAVGCVLVDVSTGEQYVNTGTILLPVWTLMKGQKLQQYAETDISAANITGTAAGQLGHANGVLLIPIAPVGYVNVLEKVVMSYTFNTAAYTGGGNTTVNIGGGGAALTGLVSAANGIGKASSNIQEFNPLAAAANTLTSAQTINLVAASAFTQPGTAAGIIKTHVWWKTVPI